MRALKLSNKSQGFTLLEIIVSIAIIGILLSISVVSYGNWKQKATIAQAKSDLLNVATAFENYKNTNNSFPVDITKIANFKASSEITLTGGSSNGDYFCINATSNSDSSVKYYISSTKKEVQSGECPAHSWKSFSMGNQHICGIGIDDQVYCWGKNDYGQLGNGSLIDSLNPVPISQGEMPSLKVKSITSGENHTCVIALNNQGYCWGGPNIGALGNSSGSASYIPVAVSRGEMPSLIIKSIDANYYNTCAIASNDQAYCWGYGSYGQNGDGTDLQRNTPVAVLLGSRPSLTVKSIFVGVSTSCLISNNDQAYCWGNNGNGLLGNNSTTDSLVPTAVSQGAMSSPTIKSMMLNEYHACAIDSNDQAYCWGSNHGGQFGNNTTANSLTPTAVLQGEMSSLIIKSISIGDSHTCAINFSDELYCWGANSYGQLGNNSLIQKLTPSSVYKNKALNYPPKFLASNNNSTCMLNTLGDIYCFGENNEGNLGFGFKDEFNKPTLLSQGDMPSLNIQSITAGEYHTCAIGTDNKAYCWGQNEYGKLGNNKTDMSPLPVAVHQGAMPSLLTKSITAGGESTCLISSNDRVYCWGRNTWGQVGDGTMTQRNIPTAILQGAMPSLTVKQISSGYRHTCAIASDDHVYCWGDNDYGQLGNGGVSTAYSPTAAVLGNMTTLSVKSIAAHGYNTCAMGFDNKAYCWGANVDGNIGDGTTTQRNVPTTVLQGDMPSSIIKSIDVGQYFACAIASDDRVYCWGDNDFNQLGDNTSAQRNTPTAIKQGSMPSLSVKKLALGHYNTCVINTNDSVYCWGYNAYAQLGNETNINSLVPTEVLNSKKYKNISVGQYHACSISIDNKTYCWGRNEYGQLGIFERSIISHNTPQLALPPQQ